jgi:hypothetical protein
MSSSSIENGNGKAPTPDDTEEGIPLDEGELSESDALAREACRFATYQITILQENMRSRLLIALDAESIDAELYHAALTTLEDLRRALLNFSKFKNQYRIIAINRHYKRLISHLEVMPNNIARSRKSISKHAEDSLQSLVERLATLKKS